MLMLQPCLHSWITLRRLCSVSAIRHLIHVFRRILPSQWSSSCTAIMVSRSMVTFSPLAVVKVSGAGSARSFKVGYCATNRDETMLLEAPVSSNHHSDKSHSLSKLLFTKPCNFWSELSLIPWRSRLAELTSLQVAESLKDSWFYYLNCETSQLPLKISDFVWERSHWSWENTHFVWMTFRLSWEKSREKSLNNLQLTCEKSQHLLTTLMIQSQNCWSINNR